MKKLTGRGVSSEDRIASRTTQGRQPKARFLVRELGGETWPDFARIVEKHNGVWGGCWCTAFHLKHFHSQGPIQSSSLAHSEMEKPRAGSPTLKGLDDTNSYSTLFGFSPEKARSRRARRASLGLIRLFCF